MKISNFIGGASSGIAAETNNFLNTIKEREAILNQQPTNAVSRDTMDILLQKKAQVVEIMRLADMLIKNNIKTWRSAWQRAINVEWPIRVELLRQYRDAMIDNHLIGCVVQRKLSCMQKTFKIVNKGTGDEDKDMTRLFRTGWFHEYMNLALDAPLYGHSLIQLGDVITVDGMMKFSDVELVDRYHVIPEYNRVIKNMGDYWGNGIDYTQPPYRDWLIGIGGKKNLGLLLAVTPQTISKRHIEAFWDQCAEIFGMPMRIGKTQTRNPAERAAMENMLKTMGSAAWGLFDEGTDIEIKESMKGDVYQIYDKRIERCEKNMSKAVLTVTMTIENGSSHSQSGTHAEMLEKVVKSDADGLMFNVNDELIPRMITHGFPLAGFEFQWDETKNYTPQEVTNLLQVLLTYYDVDQDYVTNDLNIPVKGLRPKAEAPQNIVEPKNSLDFFA